MPIVRILGGYPGVAERARAGIEKAILGTASAIEQDVKDGPHKAPYRTGNLRRSYHVETHFEEAASPYAEVGNDPGIAEYALFIEYGTSKMAAQPHLTPASEAQVQPHAERIAAALRVAG